MKKLYCVGHLEERNGGQEYSHLFLFRATSDNNARKQMQVVASQFYGDEDAELNGDDFWEFFGGEIWVGAKGYDVVTEAEYEVLNRFIAVL